MTWITIIVWQILWAHWHTFRKLDSLSVITGKWGQHWAAKHWVLWNSLTLCKVILNTATRSFSENPPQLSEGDTYSLLSSHSCANNTCTWQWDEPLSQADKGFRLTCDFSLQEWQPEKHHKRVVSLEKVARRFAWGAEKHAGWRGGNKASKNKRSESEPKDHRVSWRLLLGCKDYVTRCWHQKPVRGSPGRESMKSWRPESDRNCCSDCSDLIWQTMAGCMHFRNDYIRQNNRGWLCNNYMHWSVCLKFNTLCCQLCIANRGHITLTSTLV